MFFETNSVSRIVESMTLLMEAGMVDGEEAMTLGGEYLQASCIVTSGTGSMSFDAGETACVHISALTISKSAPALLINKIEGNEGAC